MKQNSRLGEDKHETTNDAVTITCLMALSSSCVFVLDEKKQHEGLTKNMGKAKITLKQGLGMAESQGQPISGRFELESDTEFQLSVSTAKAGKFSEVMVDYGNGKLAKPEGITQSDDLTEAKSETAAMAKAKITLKAAVDKAVSQSEGFRAISNVSKSDGHHVASVVLLKDQERVHQRTIGVLTAPLWLDD